MNYSFLKKKALWTFRFLVELITLLYILRVFKSFHSFQAFNDPFFYLNLTKILEPDESWKTFSRKFTFYSWKFNNENYRFATDLTVEFILYTFIAFEGWGCEGEGEICFPIDWRVRMFLVVAFQAKHEKCLFGTYVRSYGGWCMHKWRCGMFMRILLIAYLEIRKEIKFWISDAHHYLNVQSYA